MNLKEITKFVADNDSTFALIISLLSFMVSFSSWKHSKKQNYPWLHAKANFKEPYRDNSKGKFNQDEQNDIFNIGKADLVINIELPTKDNRTKGSSIEITIENNGVGHAYNVRFMKFNHTRIRSMNNLIEFIEPKGFRQICFNIGHDSKLLPKINRLWISYKTISHKEFKQCIKLHLEQNGFLSLLKVENTNAN